MPSILPGFEYDIFISYRHNDNRSGWVTEFVNALQEELAATLKEPVSIYFDKNLRDGLLETHQVDKTLEGKLRCIIFIPVVSQTYCDPKSFAWQHEFCAFNKLAKEQEFGRDIKLSNGNVTSRMLPVKIHDLDEGDKALIESETGGVLRSIEFIYKSPGVNRPLRIAEEQPEENLNHTTYRNQINKLANAIKQIITTLSKSSGQEYSTPDSEIPSKDKIEKKTKGITSRTAVVGASILIAAVISAFLFFSKNALSGNSAKEEFNYDVAVMYLENFTDNAKYGEQLASLVHINLTGDTGLHVLPRQRLFDEMKEATGEAVAPDRSHTTDIARKIGTRTILTGSIHQQGGLVLVQLELTDMATGKIVKTEKLEGPMDQIFDLSDKICKNMMASSMKQEFNVTLKTTGSYDAFQKFHDGLQDLYAFKITTAPQKFREAIALDSTFALGYMLLAQSQAVMSFLDMNTDIREPIQLIEKAMKYSYKLSKRDKKMVDAYYKMFTGDMEGGQRAAISDYDSIKDDRLYFLPVVWSGFTLGGEAYLRASENYLKGNPSDGMVNNQLAYLYGEQGNELLTKKYIEQYQAAEPNTLNVFDSGFEVYMALGIPDVALGYLDQYEQLAGHPSYEKRARYFLSTAKGEDLRNYYRLYTDSLPKSVSFQEMLPLSLALEGKFRQAFDEFDRLISRSEKKQEWQKALTARMHKAVLLAAAGRLDDAVDGCDDVVKRSRERLKENYNPYMFLSNYYAGLIELKKGDVNKTKERLEIMIDLRKQPMFDWRFEVYSNLLKAEILVHENEFDEAKSILDAIPVCNRYFSVGALTASYKLAWRTADYKEALNQIEPFEKNYLRSSMWQGGDPAHFAGERIFSDYTNGRIHQDAGNKQEAIRYYNIFLEKLRNSDPGIKEKQDAINRVKTLAL